RRASLPTIVVRRNPQALRTSAAVADRPGSVPGRRTASRPVLAPDKTNALPSGQTCCPAVPPAFLGTDRARRTANHDKDSECHRIRCHHILTTPRGAG